MKAQRNVTLCTKVSKELADRVEQFAKKTKKTVSKVLKEAIDESVEAKKRVVTMDVFEYDSKKDIIIWYGILESGEKWKIMPVEIKTAFDWMQQINRCVISREEIKGMPTRKIIKRTSRSGD